jgi:3-hydroxyisobutyrate dehydrogenase-like beta-hydroxyacid dehydrogenase
MRIAVIAPGAMGAAVAHRLAARCGEIAMTLEGRGAGSAARAAGLRLFDSEAALTAWADCILSILPPGEALNLAKRLAPDLGGKLFADCNAVSPQTVQTIAASVPGAVFADAGIIGGPPKADGPGPKFYVSGPGATALQALREHGLDVRPIEGGIGAASALKMSYAGITKGLTALGSTMALGAAQAGAAEALFAELADSQPELLRILQRGVPDMLPKAYRWVAEMQEIADFLEPLPAAPTYRGIAAHYAALAADQEGAGETLRHLFRRPGDKP